jgi:hypothetical protein
MGQGMSSHGIVLKEVGGHATGLADDVDAELAAAAVDASTVVI